MNETLPALGNEKEQQQVEFTKKISGELNLKMFYFTRPTG